MKKQYFLYVVMCVMTLFSCKKNDASPSQVELNSQILTNREWKGDKANVDNEVSPNPAVIIPNFDASILKFDVPATNVRLNFKSDNTFTGTGLDNQPISGRWEFQENGAKLKITGFVLQVPADQLPPEIRVLLVGVDLTLPDLYDVKEITDTKLSLYNTTTRVVNYTPAGTSFAIPVTIKPKVNIFFVR